jgi:hypothetical protein
MPSSGMLHRVAIVRTDVSEERSASMIRVTRTGVSGATLEVTRNRHTLPSVLVIYAMRRNHSKEPHSAREPQTV